MNTFVLSKNNIIKLFIRIVIAVAVMVIGGSATITSLACGPDGKGGCTAGCKSYATQCNGGTCDVKSTTDYCNGHRFSAWSTVETGKCKTCGDTLYEKTSECGICHYKHHDPVPHTCKPVDVSLNLYVNYPDAAYVTPEYPIPTIAKSSYTMRTTTTNNTAVFKYSQDGQFPLIP